ncbi:MAG: hypothetical protein GF404_13470 [candidate division Zixibacteria bacterium]|nr:hypothetical protein [candidate division Zixibacteria bacterium]
MPNRSVYIKYFPWILFWIAVFLASPYLEGLRLWGIDHLRYHPPLYTIIWAVLILLCLIPPLSRRFHGLTISLHENYQSLTGKARIVSSVGVVALFSTVFYIFRSEAQFLGDGFLRGDELARGFAHLSLTTEPLDSLLHFFFYKLTHMLFGFGAHRSFALFSALAGGLFVLVLLIILRPGRERGFSTLLLFLALGGVQFYFGYEESYSLLYMGILLFFAMAFCYFRERQGFRPLMIVFAVTALCHFTALYLLPAFLWLIISASRKGELTETDKKTALFSLLAVAVGVVFFRFIYSSPYLSKHSSFLLEFGFTGYSLLSPDHLIDIVNSLLLSALPLVLFLPVIVTSKVKPGAFEWLAFAGAVLFLIFVDPKLGMARDWDLFASTGLVMIMSFYPTLEAALLRRPDLKAIVRSAVLIAFVINLSFIAVNHSFPKNVARFEHILSLYDQRSAYGYENLGAYFRRNYRSPQELTRALEYYHKALEHNPNPRYFTSIAGTYNIFFEWAGDARAQRMLLDSIKHYADRALLYVDSLALPYDYLSLAEYYRKNVDSALIYSDSALRYANRFEKGEIHHHRGIIHLSTQNLDSAMYHFKQAIELEPDLSEPYGFLGRAYLGLKMEDSARYYFEQYLEHGPDPEVVPKIEEILEKLR